MTSVGHCALKTLLFGIGTVLLISGIIMASAWTFIFKSVLTTQLSLSKGSKTYDMWVETPLPMYLDIYLYNWTNSYESFHANATPNVEQLGPYVFREQHTKVDISWLKNATIGYRQYRKWTFHPELSNGTLSDNITNFNVIAVTLGTIFKSLNKLEKFAINKLLDWKSEHLVVTKNVSELLFEGFNDPILDTLGILKKHKINIPIPFDKFGWFYKPMDVVFRRLGMSSHPWAPPFSPTPLPTRGAAQPKPPPYTQHPHFIDTGNPLGPQDCAFMSGRLDMRNMSSTADGYFKMRTGANDISELGSVVTWNGQTEEKYYSGDCAKVDGSLGELWSPYTDTKDSIRLYASDICSWLDLQTSGTLSVFGLSGKVFTGNEDVFDNGWKSPKTKCFCVRNKKCPLSGVRDISKCRLGAPVAVSFPHFYLGDPSYREAVSGMVPVPEKHSFHLALEENTGVPLRVNARMQINLVAEPDKDLNFFSKMPHVYMPMVWFDQHATMTKEIASELKALSLLASYGMWALLGVATMGGALLLFGVYLTINKYWSSDDETLTPNESLLHHDNTN